MKQYEFIVGNLIDPCENPRNCWELWLVSFCSGMDEEKHYMRFFDNQHYNTTLNDFVFVLESFFRLDTKQRVSLVEIEDEFIEWIMTLGLSETQAVSIIESELFIPDSSFSDFDLAMPKNIYLIRWDNFGRQFGGVFKEKSLQS